MNDCAYGAELHFLKMRDLPVAKSVFPDVDYAPIAEAFGFQAATIRTLDDLQKVAPLLAKPDGPVFLDCKLNAAVAAPFMSEFQRYKVPELERWRPICAPGPVRIPDARGRPIEETSRERYHDPVAARRCAGRQDGARARLSSFCRSRAALQQAEGEPERRHG